MRKLRIPKTRYIAGAIAFVLIAAYALSMISANGQEEVIREDLASKDAYGYYIFTEMLGRLDYNIKEWKTPEQLPEDGVLVLLLPSSQYKIRNKDKLLDWVNRGNILIQCGISEKVDVLTGMERGMRTNAEHWDEWKIDNLKEYDRKIFRYQSVMIIQGAPGIRPYVYDGSEFLISGKYSGRGEIITLADISFLTNEKMAAIENAVLVSSLFSGFYDRKIYYVGSKTTAAPKSEGNPVIVLFSGRIRFISIHLLLILFLYYMAVGIRFGPPELQTVVEQRFLKRHLDGLGAFFERVNAKVFVLENLQDFYRYRFLKRLSLPGKTDDLELRENLERHMPDSAEEIIEFMGLQGCQVSELIRWRNRMESILENMKNNREE